MKKSEAERIKDKDLVRIARAILGWKQKELAKFSEVSPSYICKLESGVKKLPKYRRSFFVKIIREFASNFN